MLINKIAQSTNIALILDGGSDHLSFVDLRNKAFELKKNLSHLQGMNIALCFDDDSELIRYMLALDGFCQSIFLTPTSVDDDLADSLYKQAEIDILINNGNCIEFSSTSNVKPQLNIEQYDTRWLLPTSGTTGVPKIISHTLNSLTKSTVASSAKTADFCWGLLYDPCRFAGLQVVLQSLISGTSLIITKSNDMNIKISDLIAKECNSLSATPTLWRKILMHPDSTNFNFKQITLGGEIADQTIISLLKKQYPEARITHIYASSEVGVGFTVKDGFAGFPEHYVRLSKNDMQMRVDEKGLLFIKPLVIEQQYLSRSLSLTEHDGFINTQDLVYLKDGRYYFLGRENGAINVGGNKVHPEEVESIICTIAGIKDVLIYGKNSSMMGQLVVADIVIDKDQDFKAIKSLIKSTCKAVLETYKIPFSMKKVEAIEYNNAGKKVRNKR